MRDGRVLAFVDGSAFSPTDPRRTRAGWGVYVAEGHPLNAHGHLPGLVQTSFRGELAAAIHALATIQGPLHIISDCQAVVEGVRSIILDGETPDGDDADLWAEVVRHLRGRPNDEVEISWIKSHVSPEMADHLDGAGSFSKADLEFSARVDELARKGAAGHGVSIRNYRAADDREVIANLAQRMMIMVWSAFYSLHEDDWEHADEVQPSIEVAEDEPQPREAPHGGHPDADEGDDLGAHEDGFRRHERPGQDHRGPLHDEQGDAQSRATIITQAMSTKAIADLLRLDSPEYPWELDPGEHCTRIILPELPCKVSHAPGSHANIPGRGRMSTAIDMSPIWIEGVKWWFNNLRWTVHWASRPEHRKQHEYTVAFLELVIDAEAATGMDFPGNCWAEKASRFAALLRSLARVYTLEVDGERASWKTAFDPQATQPTLVPLDGPKLSGLSRRPRWLSRSTPSVAAANVWRALNPEPEMSSAGVPVPGRRGRSGARTTRTFAQEHRINRSGITQQVVWRTRAEKEISIARDAALRAYYDASDRWQRNLAGPMPVHPDCLSASLQARLRPTQTGIPSPSCSAKQRAQGKAASEITSTSRITSSILSGSSPSLPSSRTAQAASTRTCSSTKPADTTHHTSSTSASSCGSAAVPRVATTLHELRLQHQEDVARSAQTEISLIQANANGKAAHGVHERHLPKRG